ncbi:hypothetical protein CR513_21096, partial [Mucuna pruriens]
MCEANSIAYIGLVERGRIFKFLHDLNFEYDPIRVQILDKKFSSLSERPDNQSCLIKEAPTQDLRGDRKMFHKKINLRRKTLHKE